MLPSQRPQVGILQKKCEGSWGAGAPKPGGAERGKGKAGLGGARGTVVRRNHREAHRSAVAKVVESFVPLGWCKGKSLSACHSNSGRLRQGVTSLAQPGQFGKTLIQNKKGWHATPVSKTKQPQILLCLAGVQREDARVLFLSRLQETEQIAIEGKRLKL